MGLITGLLTLPLAPVRGVAWVAQQVTEEAERQLYDEDRIRGELLGLELTHEDGSIDEIERTRRENELLERLAVARARAAQDREGGWPPSPPEEEWHGNA
jgi:hypothetical protein